MEAPDLPLVEEAPAHRVAARRGRALVRLARPRQWVKNLLVLAAPVAAGVLHRPDALRSSIVAVLAFTLASAGGYCVNDARDAVSDRLHPSRRRRPVADGLVAPGTAARLGASLSAAGVGVAFLTGEWQLAAIVAAYVALTLAYTFGLKQVAMLDMAAVAAGFVLRMLGGAAAVGVPVSTWFLVVGSFGSLYMVAGKRNAELGHLGSAAASFRGSLGRTSPSLLRAAWKAFGVATVVTYTLWAFEKAALAGGGFPWFELSTLPFALGVVRYGLLIDRGVDSEPEEILLRDRGLQVIGAVWLALLALGIYLLHPPMT